MLELNTSRFFSDRLIFDETNPSKFQIENGFWNWIQRIIFYIASPSQYSMENRRSVECFQRYLIDTLGADRLQRISNRYELNWEKLKNYPLLSRDVAKIFIGTKCVNVEDVNDFIQANPERFPHVDSFSDLDSVTLSKVEKELASVFDPIWSVAEISGRITGKPTEWLSRIFFDPLLVDRERIQIVKEHPQDSFEHFIHNMVARVIKRELVVGSLIPAPNHPSGRVQYYYVSGKLVTGKGMVSYILHPAGKDTKLKPIRLFRGTSARNSEIDAMSTLITDLEKDLGMTAYKSGLVFERIIKETLGAPKIEAGHSMGSTLVQHRIANMDHIRKAYLYCGPGITLEEVKKFNKKNPNIELIVRIANNDEWHRFGQAHLGYQSPSNVHLDFRRYRSIGKKGLDPHVTIWSKEPDEFEMEEVMEPQVLDEHLFHQNRMKEYYRSLIGPIVAFVLQIIRDLVRFLFTSRIHVENGLQIGRMINKRWQVDHFHAV